MRWQDFQLPDGSYSDDTRPWSQQDVCNYLPTFAEAQGTRSRVKYVTVPGLRTFAGVGTGPHRGLRDVEGKLFVVSGSKLYRITPSGTSTELGAIPGTSRVSMTHNQIAGGNELVIATGSNCYVWNTVTEELTATGVPLLFVDFINQVIVGVDVGRRFWRYSGLADATSWNTLDNETAESSPDRLVGMIVSQGEVLLFGERTIEVFANSVTSSTSFQRSTVIEKGCANGNTICRLDNTVYFVGSDSIPYRLQGYTPVPIGSKAITSEIAKGNPTKLFANTWEDRGYVCYYLSAQDGRTWGYDVTCQKWHRRESFGLDRWRINTLVKWNGHWFAGDYSNGNLYRMEWGYVYEGCEIMPRTLRSGVMHGDGNPVRVHALKLLLNTGGEESEVGADPTISGSLPDGFVGDSVEYQLTVTPAYPGQSYTVTATGLPAGLSVSASGLITGTLAEAGDFTPTYTATADCGAGSVEDALTVGNITLSGDLPDMDAGIAITPYSYTTTHGVGTVTLSIDSGALPTGLSMDSAGQVTGTPSAGGTFTWVVRATDEAGNAVTLEDSAQVASAAWWLVKTDSGTDSNTLYTSDDLVSWTARTRSPFITSSDAGPFEVGIGHAIIFQQAGSGSTNVEVFSDTSPAATYTPVIASGIVSGINNSYAKECRVYDGGAILVALGTEASGNADRIRVSLDRGLTWVGYAEPGGRYAHSIVRLDNGRWVCNASDNSNSYVWYTDNVLPDGGWAKSSMAANAGRTGRLSTNGTTVCVLNGVTGAAYYSDGGASWSATTYPGENSDGQRASIAVGNVFVVAMGSNGKLKRSVDAGRTWAEISLPAACTPLRIDYRAGVMVLSASKLGGYLIYRSNDLGATWAAVTAPLSTSSRACASIRYVP